MAVFEPQGKILLSICIPTYNRSNLLRRTLRSFEGGTSEIEVIIGDNSDNDESEKSVKEELQYFKGSWSYRRNEPPIGPVDNVNQSIIVSSGLFVYVLHDDDFLVPGGLLKILAKLKEFPDKNVFKFGVQIVDIEGKIFHVESPVKEQYISAKNALLKTLSNSSFIRMPSIVIRRNAYDLVGYWDPKTAPTDDIDMFVRLFMEYGLLQSSSTVAAYTIHAGAWTEKIFNPITIDLLLEIFNKAAIKNILTQVEFRQAKGSFFSQFILGGTYRALKKFDFEHAGYIFDLFKKKELDDLVPPLKFQVIKFVFMTILFFSGINKWFAKKIVNASIK